MLHLLHLEVKSFTSLDAAAGQGGDEGRQIPCEACQARRVERGRHNLAAWALYEVVWMALRSYFGIYYLPPLAHIRAYRAGHKDLYLDWDLWVGLEVEPNQATSLCEDAQFNRLFISIDHDDHLDLLIVRDDSLELYCYPREGSHTDVRERLFQLLLSGLVQVGIPSTNLPLRVTFVDDQGLHTDQLERFLELFGLQ